MMGSECVFDELGLKEGLFARGRDLFTPLETALTVAHTGRPVNVG